MPVTRSSHALFKLSELDSVSMYIKRARGYYYVTVPFQTDWYSFQLNGL